MQINNKENGDIIVIDSINIDQNKIKFRIFNAKGDQLLSKTHTFQTINLNDYLNQSVNYTELVYNTLENELFLDSYYVVEEDTQNWLSDNKSMRFFIPSEIIVEGVQEQNGFNDVINNIIADSQTDPDLLIINQATFTTIYANSVASENQSVIDPLIADGTITVENKIV